MKGGYFIVPVSTRHLIRPSLLLYASIFIIAIFTLIPTLAHADTPNVSEIYAMPETISQLNGSANIFYTLNGSENGHVSLEIHSAGGDMVNKIDVGYLANGSYNLSWDGKDENAVPVPNGIYSAGIRYVISNYAVAAEWGGLGNKQGQINGPSDVALDDEGNVYVTEYYNHRVQKFGPSGNFLLQWGGEGSGEGQFSYPSGIAVSTTGIVYVVDFGNSRVQMFSTDGGYISQWGSAGSGKGQFNMPHGIAVDSQGNVYVADMGNSRVQKFGPTGKYLGKLGDKGMGDGHFISPIGVAIGSNDMVYVTDIDSNKVQQFTSDDDFIGTFGSAGSGDGQLSGPAGIATDGSGNVYVCDIRNHRVVQFDSSGSFVRSYGNNPDDSTLNSPCGISVSGDSVYVADITNNNIQLLTLKPEVVNAVAYNETRTIVERPDTTGDDNATNYSTYIISFKNTSKALAASGNTSTVVDQVKNIVSSYNGSVVRQYKVINAMAVTMPDDKADEVRALDNVKYVEKDQEVYAVLDKAVPQIGGDQVWASGYSGKGIKVAVIDTGIDGSHPDLNGSKIVAWVDYVNNNLTPYDDNGHGTHVSSTIAGTGAADNGQYKGVAPNASLMGAKVLDKNGAGSSSALISAIDWAVQNHADVISLSLGSPVHVQAVDDAVDNAINAGIVVVIAAGNSGPTPYTIDCPGDDPNAITVGASDRSDQIAYFSSRGPNYDGSVKPDVTNMGVGLVAARASGTSMGTPVDTYYTAASGTSMATPMTSGTVALLLSAKPSMTPYQVKYALEHTAKPEGASVPNNDYGYGRVDAKAALDYVLGGQLPTPTPIPVVPAPPAPDNDLTPSTIATISGLPGNNSWYLSNVTVTLSAQDKSGTGINEIDYSLDGISWASYSKPFAITEEGTTTIQFKSTDNAGHQEQAKSENIRIDRTPPQITGAATSSPLVNGWYKGSVIVHFEATDMLSGIDSVTPDQAITTSGPNQSVIGTAIDLAGNKAYYEVKLNVDNEAPVSDCTLNGVQGGKDWFRSDVHVIFSAADDKGSGVKLTEYSLDGGDWQPAVPIVISKEGLTTIYYRSVDQVGNQESTQSMAVKVDKTVPVITGAPLTGPGDDGWYDTDVTVHFTATDALSGIASISGDQIITTEGAHQSVTGSATDVAGNIANTIVGGINIDRSPPVTSCILEGESGGRGDNAWYRSDVNVTLVASDGSGIGVKGTEYEIDGGPWTPYTGHFNITKEGISNVYFRSVDMLDHMETAQVRQVKIDRVPPEIFYTVNPPLDKNQWYTDTVTVHFTGSDDKSGIGSVTPDIYLSEDGVNQSVIGYVYDMAGNMNWTQVSGINIDMKSPVTMCTLDHVPTKDGWFNTAINASLEAFDNNGTGTNWTEYKLNDQDWVKYVPNSQIPIIAEGTNTIYYRSVDNVSHLEPINARSVKIDRTPPNINYQIIGGGLMNGWYNQNVTVHFSGSDNISGISSTTPDTVLTQDGPAQTVTGHTIDKAGNSNSTTTAPINIDTTAPLTIAYLTGSIGNNGWYISPVTVTLRWGDGGSGVNVTRYSLNNLSWQTYNGPFTISDEGNTTVYYYSIDDVNNTEKTESTSMSIDMTSPNIVCNASGIMGTQDWYRSNVAITFNATDTGLSGLAKAEYTIDGTNWAPVGAFTLSNDGSYNVQYRAYSNAGTTFSGSRTVNIDKTAPTIGNITPGIDAQGAFIDQNINVKFNSSMNPASISTDTFYLMSGDARVPGHVRSVSNNGATFSPDANLAANTKYTVLLTTGLKDLAGNSLAQNYSWSFTTGALTRALVNNTTSATPTATPIPTEEATPIPVTPSPTAIPGNPISGMVPIVLAFIAILAIGGVIVFYLVKVKK